ncbi:MAG: lytic murein transglycosylase [Maritimibacter sp.]
MTRETSVEAREFAHWIEIELKPRVLQQQIRPAVFARAKPYIKYLPEALKQETLHNERLIPIWDMIDSKVSERRIRAGRQALRRNRDLFNRLEQAFGVEAEMLMAIWGVETQYGAKRGTHSVLSVLATLAWRGRRQGYYEDELVAALRLVQSGACRAEQMHGSLSGAVGHGQLMPTAILDFAVDFDGDGVASLCADSPDDALASIAHFLKKHGWKKGQPWGFEIVLPKGFDCCLIGINEPRPISEWRALGIVTPDGMPIPDYGPGAVYLPTGIEGVAVLTLNNFHVLLRHDYCLPYALTIGHLSDRIGGGKAFHGDWPRGEAIVNRSELHEIQHLLTSAGYDTHGLTGLPGAATDKAVRAWQQDNGVQPDGFLSQRLLLSLRGFAGQTASTRVG